MEHKEAVEQMATERYLLDELTPEERDAFEEHYFDCQECAADLRAGTAFVDEAKAQLPELTATLPERSAARTADPKMKRNHWLSWWGPAFAVPAMAALLLVVGYQNLVMFPALRASANQPRLLPWVPLHGATRGGHLQVTADHRHGVALPVELSQSGGSATYTSYSVDLKDPDGKLAWTGAVAALADGADQRVSLEIPGAMLRSGSYTVTVSGVGQQSERTVIDQYVFDLHLTD